MFTAANGPQIDAFDFRFEIPYIMNNSTHNDTTLELIVCTLFSIGAIENNQYH